MSLEIARDWARRALRHPNACDDAVALFEQCDSLGVQGSLLAAPELTPNGYPCLARWTGAELLVLQLSPLFIPQRPLPPCGTWVLFLQLVKARVWGRPNEGCTAVSNMAAAVAEVR